MFAERFVIAITTDGAGAATAYSPSIAYGRLQTIRYVKDNFADGVDVAITAEGTGETLWQQDDVNASVTVAPRQATHGVDGAAALYAAGGTAVRDYIVLVRDRIKIVIASGGAGTSGTFHLVIG